MNQSRGCSDESVLQASRRYVFSADQAKSIESAGQFEIIGDPYSSTDENGNIQLDNKPYSYSLVKPKVIVKKGQLGSNVPYTSHTFVGVV